MWHHTIKTNYRNIYYSRAQTCRHNALTKIEKLLYSAWYEGMTEKWNYTTEFWFHLLLVMIGKETRSFLFYSQSKFSSQYLQPRNEGMIIPYVKLFCKEKPPFSRSNERGQASYKWYSASNIAGVSLMQIAKQRLKTCFRPFVKHKSSIIETLPNHKESRIVDIKELIMKKQIEFHVKIA